LTKWPPNAPITFELDPLRPTQTEGLKHLILKSSIKMISLPLFAETGDVECTETKVCTKSRAVDDLGNKLAVLREEERESRQRLSSELGSSQLEAKRPWLLLYAWIMYFRTCR
jgi:hypothetical protein